MKQYKIYTKINSKKMPYLHWKIINLDIGINLE